MVLRRVLSAWLLVSLGGSTRLVGDVVLDTALVAGGFSQPLYVSHAPDDFDRIFVVEQPGRIKIVDISQDPPAVLATPFLDIRSIVNDSNNEQGLLGMAFHPDYGSNRRFYVNYTASNGDTVVSEFTVPAGTPNDADESSERVVLSFSQPFWNHNGGWIAFGPNDGYLYIATGDGGHAGDSGPGHTEPGGNAQDTSDNKLGKLLRIDVDGNNAPSGQYGIPPDNPFVSTGGDDEIWAYGLRNPWRCGFDSATGDLFIADVGQNLWEEIDFQPAAGTGGENYGWRCREGAHDFDAGDPVCAGGTFVEPIHEFGHGGNPFKCSITGGEVYRGCALPELGGVFFFADFCSNEVWTLDYNGAIAIVTDRTAELGPLNAITSFGLDAAGEIYICERGGQIRKIVPAGGGGGPSGGDDVCVDDVTGERSAIPCSRRSDCSSGTSCGLKSRHISFSPAVVADGLPLGVAFRVEIVSSTDFPGSVGNAYWLGAPDALSEGPTGGSYRASLLQCTIPPVRDWCTERLIHTYGPGIVPGATYEIRAADQDCIDSGASTSCMSAPVTIETGTWGDVVGPYDRALDPDFDDIDSLVSKFQSKPGAPIKARALLCGELLNPTLNVGFDQISASVGAFKGKSYSQTCIPVPSDPPSCP